MKRTVIDHTKIDWKLTNAAIARNHHVDTSTILRLRKRLGIKPAIQKDRVLVPDWRKLDWENLNNRQIAEQVGGSPSLISAKRKEYAKHRPKPRHIGFKWEGQDWTQHDVDIAKERGMKVGSVASARSRHANGISAPRRKHKLCKRQAERAEIEAKLSERKTVHEWLNALNIPQQELNKTLCLLRRLRILCDRHQDFKTEVAIALEAICTNIDIDGNSMSESDAAFHLRKCPIF